MGRRVAIDQTEHKNMAAVDRQAIHSVQVNTGENIQFTGKAGITLPCPRVRLARNMYN